VKLRNTLKNLKFDEDNKEKNTQLFEVLYKTWYVCAQENNFLKNIYFYIIKIGLMIRFQH